MKKNIYSEETINVTASGANKEFVPLILLLYTRVQVHIFVSLSASFNFVSMVFFLSKRKFSVGVWLKINVSILRSELSVF